jgi:uncharacterized protein with GYD domain
VPPPERAAFLERLQPLGDEAGRNPTVEDRSACKSLGGALEAFYFAFGDTDVYAIAEAPDHASAAAVSLAVTASGAVHAKTIVLMTPEEMDQATRKTVSYRAPGA